ncbi:hypothetical protein C8F04DRAFT_1306042 [Mycena alexandri]|uniref:Uncharacterized protein n=1 Tax=Mycena alexandri TaxID=1745969 RepID=A0AAD6SAR0_9AGAR|nr:hypothetical protein C8F04DRAFT_1306042 [Mycena alexandri]
MSTIAQLHPVAQYTASQLSLAGRSKLPQDSFLRLDSPSDQQFTLDDFKLLTFSLLPTMAPAGPRRSRTQTHRTKSTYLGTSSVIVIPTARSSIVPLRAVRDHSAPDALVDEPEIAPPVQLQQRRPSLLRKLILGILHPRTQSTASSIERPVHHDEGSVLPFTEDSALPHTPDASTPPPAFGIRCTKYGAKVPNAAFSAETITVSPPVEPRVRRKLSRSFSGYFCPLEPEEVTTPEGREAMDVNARIFDRGYRYEALGGGRGEVI